MVVENDTRGWIMTCISGVACICGASIIGVDILVRTIPKYRHFQIAKSDTFLSASLSLSFGVMADQLFSALYSMLPNAKKYLISAGLSPRRASWLLIGLFLAGVVGIQVLSRALHHFIPTHIIDCHHTHGDEEAAKGEAEMEQHQQHDHDSISPLDQSSPQLKLTTDQEDEETPLLVGENGTSHSKPRQHSAPESVEADHSEANGFVASTSRRHSRLPRSLTRTLSKITASQLACDEAGPCKGFSDRCGQDCFEVVTRRGSGVSHNAPSRQATFQRTQTYNGTSLRHAAPVAEIDQISPLLSRSHSATDVTTASTVPRSRSALRHTNHTATRHRDRVKVDGHHRPSDVSGHPDAKAEHHHHVPTNAFLSIGLQTSLAIALHKAPEGFITYATNHANPQLGFAVFMALFIHNITEGFAMALPLYLALQSRTKAVVWSSFLGGVSQPLGAGVAAIWFKVANGTNGMPKPSEDVYGCMFAVTAGVMASVALQLFSESLGLTHNKTVCIGFAFLGMGILGVSSALTA